MTTAIFVVLLFITLILLAIGATIDGIRKGIIAFVLEMQKAGAAAAEAAKAKEVSEDDD